MIQKQEILAKKIKELERIGDLINAPEWLLGELRTPKTVLKMKIRASVAGKPTILNPICVLHCNPYATGASPYKGGLRYHPSVTEERLTVFGIDMIEKNALARLPFGGAKSGIPLDPSQCSETELRDITEQMTMEMLKYNIPHPDIYVPGPDIGTNPTIMFWMYVKIAEMNHFRNISNVAATVTGKPVKHNGMPGREDATSRGLLIQLKEFLRLSQLKLSYSPTIAIQGFGNVGANIVRLMKDEFPDFRVVAVSDASGGIHNPAGLSIEKMEEWQKKHKTFAGYPEASAISNKELLELQADVLIPAAIEDQITEDNAHVIRASLVYEAANEAITPEANAILYDRGIPVVPGIVANVGGVVVSFIEWSKNRGDRKHQVDFAEVKEETLSELTKIMQQVIQNVWAKSTELSCSLPDAAHILAMETIRDGLREKHSYQD